MTVAAKWTAARKYLAVLS